MRISATWAPWVGATACTGGPTAGAKALLAWALESFPSSRSLGIYNCRTVRGGLTTSLHGEGRAVDVGFPVRGGLAHDDGRTLVAALGEHGRRLGVQAVIFDRRIYSASSPAGRPYRGVSPHVDHAHVELTHASADRLTLATLRAVTGLPAPAPIGAETMLSRGDKGRAVELFQRCLEAEARASGRAGGDPLPRFGADGDYGAETEAAVKAYQAGAQISTTGRIDGVTAALLVRYA